MSAVLAMEDVRLYSKAPRMPVDVVAPQHAEIHHDLDRWGLWNRDRYQPGTCASMEKLYYKGGDTTPPATAPTLANPRHLAIDRAVRRMSMGAHQHSETIKLYYVTRPVRRIVMRGGTRIEVRCTTAQAICGLLTIHWKDFGTWMFDCRSMVVNIIREIS
jgi:hypothetical protein